MTRKGHINRERAAEHHGPESTHREANQLGGDGDHVAEMSHANLDHSHAGAGTTEGDEIAKHRTAHFGMSPAPAKSAKASKPTKPIRTGKHAKQ